MGFRLNVLEEVDELLEAHGLKITMPEAIIKRNASVINDCIRRVHARTDEEGNTLPVTIIVCSIDRFHDVEWLVQNVLDNELKRILVDELMQENPIFDAKIRSKLFKKFS